MYLVGERGANAAQPHGSHHSGGSTQQVAPYNHLLNENNC